MTDEFKYRAFISYSHADESWASWLHRALESYRVPRRLIGTVTEFGVVPERIAPVFRDRDELTAATNLGDKLTRALEQSAFQIVICSPAAAKSRWVNEEILTYKRFGREHRVFCLIVAGEPGASARPETAHEECFPRALIHKLGPDGELSDERSEPIAADARRGKDSRLDAKLKLIAGMLGVGLDELKQREAARRHRRMALLATASVAGMAVTSVLATAAWLARNDAQRQRVRAEAEAETARQTTQFMIDLFKVSDPSEALGKTITAKEILDKGAKRIDAELKDQPGIQATLMDTMGTVYTSLNLYDQAVPLVRNAVAKRRALLGDQSVEFAQSLNHLGEVLTLTSDFEEAEKSLRSALAIRRARLGNEHPDVADTLSALAEVLSQEGRSAEGEPLIQEALRIRRARFGDVSTQVAASTEALGLNFYERGNYDRAIVELRKALEMRRKLHGELHPALAQSMDNLAWALMGLGKWTEAEELCRDALRMKEKLYGKMHSEYAAALNNLAYVFESQGQYRAAETQYRESLDINRKLVKGKPTGTIATTMSNLAFVEYAEGKRDDAIKLLRESLEMNRTVLGPDHPDVGGGAASLAYWLIDAKQYDEAGELIEESLRIRRKSLGERHPQVASTLTVKAMLMLAQRRYDDARDLAREAEAVLRDASVPDDQWQVAAARSVEGAALAKLGQYAEAEKLLLASRAPLAQAPIADLESKTRRRLEDLYVAWGKPEKAEELRAAQ
jgi:tetratricopeptide (TPR) repeat protein